MKKNIKRMISAALVMTVLFDTCPTQADAKKVTAPKLSVSKLSLEVSKTAKVKVKNVKKSQINKLLVKLVNKKIATIKNNKNSFTVTAKKKGNTKVNVTLNLKKAINGKKKYKLSLKLAVTNINTSTPSQTPGQDDQVADEYATDSQKEVEKILQSVSKSGKKSVLKITKEATDITIPQGTYKNVSLIVDAPKADIVNYGVFNSVEIRAIAKDTYTEKAKGNRIVINADAGRIVIPENASIGELVIVSDRSDILVEVKGKVDNIVLEATAKLTLNVSGEVGEIGLTAQATLDIRGESDNTIPITMKEGATGARVASSVPIAVDTAVAAEIDLDKGAEKSSISVSDDKVSVSVDNNTSNPVSYTTPGGETKDIGAGKSVEVVGNNVFTEKEIPQTPAVPSGGGSVVAPQDKEPECKGIVFTHDAYEDSGVPTAGEIVEYEKYSLKAYNRVNNYDGRRSFFSIKNDSSLDAYVSVEIYYFMGNQIVGHKDGFSENVSHGKDFVVDTYDDDFNYDSYEIHINSCHMLRSVVDVSGIKVYSQLKEVSEDGELVKYKVHSFKNESDKYIDNLIVQIVRYEKGSVVDCYVPYLRGVPVGETVEYEVRERYGSEYEVLVLAAEYTDGDYPVSPNGEPIQFAEGCENEYKNKVKIVSQSSIDGHTYLEVENTGDKDIRILPEVYLFKGSNLVKREDSEFNGRGLTKHGKAVVEVSNTYDYDKAILYFGYQGSFVIKDETPVSGVSGEILNEGSGTDRWNITINNNSGSFIDSVYYQVVIKDNQGKILYADPEERSVKRLQKGGSVTEEIYLDAPDGYTEGECVPNIYITEVCVPSGIESIKNGARLQVVSENGESSASSYLSIDESFQGLSKGVFVDDESEDKLFIQIKNTAGEGKYINLGDGKIYLFKGDDYVGLAQVGDSPSYVTSDSFIISADVTGVDFDDYRIVLETRCKDLQDSKKVSETDKEKVSATIETVESGSEKRYECIISNNTEKTINVGYQILYYEVKNESKHILGCDSVGRYLEPGATSREDDIMWYAKYAQSDVSYEIKQIYCMGA